MSKINTQSVSYNHKNLQVSRYSYRCCFSYNLFLYLFSSTSKLTIVKEKKNNVLKCVAIKREMMLDSLARISIRNSINNNNRLCVFDPMNFERSEEK